MESSDDTPNELLERLKGGDEQALAEVFSKHRERLWRMVRFRLDRRLHQRVDPEDILQDAYLDAAQRLQHFVQESYPSVFLWLRQIVSQTLIDAHRRHLGAQKRDARRDVPIHGSRYPQATSTSLAIKLVGNLTSPSHAAMRAEMAGLLERAIETMDPIDREILALRHFEELTNSEVAAVLDIQQKAASIRYVRAVKRLKQILSQIPAFTDNGEGDAPREE